MMARTTLVWFILLWVFSGCCAAKNQLEIKSTAEPSPYFWDFGPVKAGTVLEHKFVFKNNSKGAINIHGTDTSCSCAISKIEKNVLAPGESTKIKVSFKTEGYKGEVQQFVYVNTDDPNNPISRFTVKAKME